MRAAPLTITASAILSNTTGNGVGSGDGAGIALYDTFFISGTRIVSNTALFDSDDDSGGGLAAHGYDRGYILNSIFAHNSASYGGAVYISRYGAYITGTAFHDNFAWQHGGALYGGLSSYDGLLSLENTTLDHNTTRGDGGGYYADSGEHLFQNVTLVNNTADVERDNAGDGGGLTIGSYTTVRARNTVLAANAVNPPETRAVYANCFTNGYAAVLESLGHNTFGIGASCPISGLLPSDLIGVDPRLASRDADGALSPLGQPAHRRRRRGRLPGCRPARHRHRRSSAAATSARSRRPRQPWPCCPAMSTAIAAPTAFAARASRGSTTPRCGSPAARSTRQPAPRRTVSGRFFCQPESTP